MGDVTRPLAGVRVLELGGGVAAPFCTLLLGELGAEVVKVEPPWGDPTRRVGPFLGNRPHHDTGTLFLALNAGKRSVVLDLATQSGRAVLRRLVARSSIVVSGLRPRSIDRLGIDDPWIAAVNAACVRVAITSFGCDGPLRDAEASELVACAAGGLAYVTGRFEDPPMKAALEQCQRIAGAHAAVAALAALWHLETTGEGQRIDVSVQEVVASILQGKLSYYSYMGCVARRQPRSAGSLQHALLPCRDGWIAPMFVPTANVDWELFATFLDLPELLEERFATRAGRIAHAAELERIITARLQERTKFEWFHAAQEWRLTFGVVQTPEEITRCPQLEARGFWRRMDHPVAGPLRVPGASVVVDRPPPATAAPAPRLGEHTASVLREVGLDVGDVPVLAATSGSQPRRSRPPAISPPSGPRPPFVGPTPGPLPPVGGPLRGIRVVECGEAYAVPHLTRLLADLGADVVKVESCQRPDVVRVWPFPDNRPGEEFWNRGGVFNEPNRNKRDVTLNLRDPRGVEAFRRLVATADVVCENYTPRVMEQLGLDYPRLRQVKPDIIMLSSTGYGHSGPWRDYTAWGFTVEPTAGLCHFVGHADGPPLRTGIAYVDMPAAAIGAVAVLAALRRRRMSGEGCWIDLSQYEVGVTFIGEALIAAAAGLPPQSRTGNRDRSLAPQGMYPCAGNDRWVALTVRDDADWQALTDLIGRPDLLVDVSLATAEGRRAAHDRVDEAIATWSRQRSAEEAAEELRSRGLCAAVAMTVKDLLLDAHLRYREFFILARHRPEAGDDLGTRPYPGMVARLSRTPGTIWRAAPLLGEDNAAVLGDLGYDECALAEMERDRVIGTRPIAERLHALEQHEVPYEDLLAAGIITERDDDYRRILGLE